MSQLPWKALGNTPREPIERYLDQSETNRQRVVPVVTAALRRIALSCDAERQISVGVNHFRRISAVERKYRHSRWATKRSCVMAAMESVKVIESRQGRMRNCGSAAYIVRDVETGEHRVRSNTCHDRFCSVCGARRSRTIANNLMIHIGERRVVHMVLTLRHTRHDLPTQITHLYESFTRLRRRTEWRKCINGGAAFLEIKRSQDGSHWHPHLHVIYEGSNIPQYQMAGAWKEVTNGSSIVWMKRVTENARQVRYICKYASKPLDDTIFSDQKYVGECIVGMRGRRMCMTFGTWRGLKLEGQDVRRGEWVYVAPLDATVRSAMAGDKEKIKLLALLRCSMERFDESPAGDSS